MKPRITLNALALFFFMFTATMTYAKDFIIYSIVKNIPMGHENEVVQKNFYVNIGSKQGIEPGNKLDVYRTNSRLDPNTSKKRYNYSVKIGTLNVLHSEDNSAIANLDELNIGKAGTPLFEIENLMIGDKVEVKVK